MTSKLGQKFGFQFQSQPNSIFLSPFLFSPFPHIHLGEPTFKWPGFLTITYFVNIHSLSTLLRSIQSLATFNFLADDCGQFHCFSTQSTITKCVWTHWHSLWPRIPSPTRPLYSSPSYPVRQTCYCFRNILYPHPSIRNGFNYIPLCFPSRICRQIHLWRSRLAQLWSMGDLGRSSAAA